MYEARIHVHRCEYISERDFARIRGLGLNSVRIPVPYFIFGDCPPFIGCVEELDKAFSWAEKYGLKILIDLHTVPGSQNGFDNGGICGVCTWSSSPENVKFTLDLLEKLAVRYNATNIFDYIELTSNYSIFEIAIIPEWAGESISDINVRQKFNVNIIAVKRDNILEPMPAGDFIFRDNDHIIVIGKSTDVFRLSAKTESQ